MFGTKRPSSRFEWEIFEGKITAMTGIPQRKMWEALSLFIAKWIFLTGIKERGSLLRYSGNQKSLTVNREDLA